MATTFSKRDARSPLGCGHGFFEFTPTSGWDTFTASRWFSSFDLSGYTGGDAVIYGPSADGTVLRTTTVIHGNPDTPQGVN